MAQIPETLAFARQHHQAGNLYQAEQLYRQILQTDPTNAQVCYLLGALYQGLGQLTEAAASLQQSLKHRPDHPETHNHLGVVFAQQRQLDQAIASFRQAIQLKPDLAQAHNNLGNVLMEKEQHEDAAAAYQEAVHFNPAFAEAHNNLGLARAAQGRWDEAVASYQEALRLKPDYAKAHYNLRQALRSQGKLDEEAVSGQQAARRDLEAAKEQNDRGLALMAEGKLDEAIASFREALQFKPDSAEAYSNLGVVFAKKRKLDEAVANYQQALRIKPDYPEAQNNLGVALADLGRTDEAIARYRQAVRIRPTFVEGHYNLGNALAQQEKLDEAVASQREALRLKPDYAEAHNNLGAALIKQGKASEAEACYREALRIRPDYVEARKNLGSTLLEMGKPQEAVACFEQALELKPDYADAHFHRSIVWLLMGNFEAGWPEYEWRWRGTYLTPRQFSQPLWDGSALEGRTILLHAEQGLGDALQFIRYAPLVKERGGRVIVECPQAMAALLSACPGIDRIIPGGSALPAFDVHTPLLSVPRILGTTLATVPANVPYVFPSEELVEKWRRELAILPSPLRGEASRGASAPGGGRASFKIGIAWKGSSKYQRDRFRSIPLARFEPLAGVEGVQLFSLQKGEGAEQLQTISNRFSVTDLGSRLDLAGAFVDTAAVMKNLDLVITSDTAIPHLAGALGVPVWVALPFVPDWRWLMHREDSPWYPTMRLFRQTEQGNWSEVFERIAAAVHERMGKPPVIEPIVIGIAPGELIDKITILEIKSRQIKDTDKLANIRAELAALRLVRDREIKKSAELKRLTVELKTANETLWRIEDEIRACEREQEFGSRFVELARSVYRTNDQRSALKRRINELLDSSIIEEKSYTSYN
jgi:tetratricopeptide (TPR) repeat protein